jgi:hypothetical protein
MTTKKLKFLVDGVVNGEVVFKAGEIYDIPVETGSVTRWLKRGAVEVEEVLDEVEKKTEQEEIEISTPKEVRIKSKKSKTIESL